MMTIPTAASHDFPPIIGPIEEPIFVERRGARTPDVVYLASPYSHTNPEVMEWRYRAAVAAAAHLMLQGDVVFSPIAHSHAIGKALDKQAGGAIDPNTHAFWMAQDLPMLHRADRLVVLMLPGWSLSLGVTEEIDAAVALGKPVRYLAPSRFGFDEPEPSPYPPSEEDEPASAFEPTETQTFGELLCNCHGVPQSQCPDGALHRAFARAVVEAMDEGAKDMKDTNPKDGIGATKLPLSLVPPTALAHASLAHLDGALKYGRWNWRIAGVRASIYLDATRRHLAKWEAGEECDPDSGVHHLGHALACMNILLDAEACGKLHDDRPPSVDLAALFDRLTPQVEEAKRRHAARNPRHYSIEDTQR